MEQHPIPQAISTYEFRLVGEMTLKQFSKLTFGLVIAFIFYISPLPFYFKWPLIAIFVILGVGLAFVPIGGRPLETWIASFIRAIYSPTEYIYKKLPELPEFLQKRDVQKPVVAAPAPPQSVPSRAKLKEYLGTLPTQEKATAWEQAEKRFLTQVSEAFEKIQVPSPAQTPTLPPIPKAPKIPKSKPVDKPLPPKKTTLPEPTKPAVPTLVIDKPNLIAGTIKDKAGKFVEGAIVEIKDSQGFPVRALKTNSLGQFRSVSPLENGSYQIEVEKEGLNFDIIKINLEGKIVLPLEIKAQ